MKCLLLGVPAMILLVSLAEAHIHPVENEEDCTCEPGAKAFSSYHIHVLFYPDGIEQFENNTHNSKHARALRASFVKHFNTPECDKTRIYNLTGLCVFEVDETGAGGVHNAAPFVLPNFAIYVPVDRYAEVVPWMMANRGDLDFLLHPNTCGYTCASEDHLLWSVWGGNKGQVRFQLPRLV